MNSIREVFTYYYPDHKDLCKWYERLFLFFLPSYVLIEPPYVWTYKTFRGKIYFIKYESTRKLMEGIKGAVKSNLNKKDEQ